MWDFESGLAGHHRYLVIGFTREPSTDAAALPVGDDLIVSGPLLADDGASVLGGVVAVEARSPDNARAVLAEDQYTGIEAHQWRFGGRSETSPE